MDRYINRVIHGDCLEVKRYAGAHADTVIVRRKVEGEESAG